MAPRFRTKDHLNGRYRRACDEAQERKNWRQLSDHRRLHWVAILVMFPVFQGFLREMDVAEMLDIIDKFLADGLVKIRYTPRPGDYDEWHLDVAPIEILETNLGDAGSAGVSAGYRH